jgi:hypothetical protein
MHMTWALRFACVLTVFLGFAPEAMASERSPLLHRMSCTVVRYYVALYSATAAEQYARSKGATDADIEAARRCIKTSDNARTASAQ